jgi:hypothetical protein
MLMLLAACGFFVLSMVVTASPNPAPPSFAGQWKLQTKSPHVPPEFLAMNVSQTATELKVDLNIGSQPGAAKAKYQTRLYDLSGKETLLFEDDDPQKVAATLIAEPQPDGKMLLKMNRLTTDRGRVVVIEHKSLWELKADGSLKITEFLVSPEAVDCETVTRRYSK